MMGDLTIFPIVEWKTATTPAGYGVLTIRILPLELGEMRPARLEKIEEARHFGISDEQAELLAQDLIRMAAELREKRKSSN